MLKPTLFRSDNLYFDGQERSYEPSSHEFKALNSIGNGNGEAEANPLLFTTLGGALKRVPSTIRYFGGLRS